MAAKDKPSDILDWTIHDDLQPGDPLPPWPAEEPSAPAPPPHRWPVRRWASLAAAAGLIIISPWLYLRWQGWQTEQAVGELIAAEAAPTAVPLVGLAPAEGDTPSLGALTQLSPTTVRADVIHRYLGPEGRPLAFAQPRFFEQTAAGWELLATPPADFPGEVQTWAGARFQLAYYAADAALIEGTLAPFLAELFDRACQTIACPDDFKLTFDFVNAPSHSAEQPAAPPAAGEPWLFSLLARDAMATRQWLQTTQRVAAPHRVGAPSDAAALDLWKRSLGLRALAGLARASSAQAIPGDGFFIALIARLAARLDLEPAAILEYALADKAVITQYLQDGTHLDDEREIYASALTLLNAVLRGPTETEARLWQTLAELPETEFPGLTWIIWGARAAGVSAEEFYARLRAAAGLSGPVETGLAADAELALACAPNPMLYGPNGLRPVPGLEGLGGYSWVVDWSQDGRRLALVMLMQTTVVDVTTGRLTWPPVGLDSAALAFYGYWLAGDRLAYNEFSFSIFSQPEFDPQSIRLMIWDTGRGALEAGAVGLGLLPDMLRRAPDRQALAVLALEQDNQSSPGTWGVLAADGTTLTNLVSEAFPPAWSPDSQSLAFVHQDRNLGGVSLHIWPLGGETVTRLWNSRATPEFPVDETTQFSLAWSGDGAWLALAARDSREQSGWLALIPAAGGALRLLSVDQTPASNLSFSYDGRWLAATASNNQSTDLVIYDVQRGVEHTRLAGGWWQQPQWAPRANRLLAFQSEHAYLIEQPGGEPVPLGDLDCSMGVWRP